MYDVHVTTSSPPTHTHTLGAGDTDWEGGECTPEVEGAGWGAGQAAGQAVEGTPACGFCQCSASPVHSGRWGRCVVLLPAICLNLSTSANMAVSDIQHIN